MSIKLLAIAALLLSVSLGGAELTLHLLDLRIARAEDEPALAVRRDSLEQGK